MTSVIMMGLENRNLGNEANQNDAVGALDHIQERLIHANLIRRNRIYFATQDMRAAVEKRRKEEQERLRAAGADKVEVKPAQSAQVPSKREETGSAAPNSPGSTLPFDNPGQNFDTKRPILDYRRP